MKKLTAGIFASILTVVCVNAADAAITSKAYVDGLVGGVEANVTKNTTNITNLTKTVDDNKTATDKAIEDLDKKVSDAVGEGGSVADQIADALGGIPEGSTVAAELGKKQDKSTADYTMGTAAGGWKALTDTEKGALQSGITAAGVTQITINATDITNLKAKDTEIEGKIGTLPEGQTSVIEYIKTVETSASSNVDDKLGDLGEGNETVADALAQKQDMLGATNVTTTGTGNAIVSISAADGVVTATKGAVIPEVTTRGETGTFVLTATVTDAGVTNYMWESIERATAAAGE